MSFDTLNTQLKEMAQNGSGGIAAVMLDKNSSGFHFYGEEGSKKDSIFEIGSVTKIFSALLLLVLENEGTVGRADTIDSYLDIDFSDPAVGKITLGQLAMHTSGLPRIPDNLNPVDERDPYADYTKDDLYEFLQSFKLAEGYPNGEEMYSNTGFGLLGHLLSVAADNSFESLLKQNIFTPLNMEDTSCYLDEGKKQRFMQGNDEDGKKVGRWHSDVMQGDGALVSTPADMAKFLQMCCGFIDSPLTRLVDDMVADYVDFTGDVGVQQVLGWLVVTPKDGGKLFVWHNGETGGYKSFVGFTLDKKIAIALLANGKFDLSTAGAVLLSEK